MDERLNLVRRAVRRKPGAFETLMEQEKEYLYKMAFLYCREEQMALDTVAETVAKAYVGIGKLKKPEYFRTWLTRILINEALRAKEKSGNWLPWEAAELQKENSMNSLLKKFPRLQAAAREQSGHVYAEYGSC